MGSLIKLNLQDQTLQKLKQLFSGGACDFLGFTLDLEAGGLTDKLHGESVLEINEGNIQIVTTLLEHYASAKSTILAGKLIKFRDLPSGCAYEGAFNQRAIQPIAEVFGEKPNGITKAAKLLGGFQLELGDASVEISALKGIPLTYIVWGSDEFGGSASILYDQSASNYLPTEDLAVLGELTTMRLIQAECEC